MNPQAKSLSCKMINVAVKFKEKTHPLQGSGEYFLMSWEIF